jgi:hypothetical protein
MWPRRRDVFLSLLYFSAQTDQAFKHLLQGPFTLQGGSSRGSLKQCSRTYRKSCPQELRFCQYTTTPTCGVSSQPWSPLGDHALLSRGVGLPRAALCNGLLHGSVAIGSPLAGWAGAKNACIASGLAAGEGYQRSGAQPRIGKPFSVRTKN